MEYFIKITKEFDKDGKGVVNYTSDGFTEFEIIGILTYYRDKIEVARMYRQKPNKQESEGEIKTEKR